MLLHAVQQSNGKIENMMKAQTVWKDILTSWMALKTWVKVWLVALNLVLLGSFAFLHDPAGKWTAIAYVGAAPFLLAIMVPQRGLSRILGLGHIIPWFPLLAYLGLRISSETVGPRLTAEVNRGLFWYVVIVIATVGVCLVFDVYDVIRWFRGERYIMGSEEAFRAGASLRARD